MENKYLWEVKSPHGRGITAYIVAVSAFSAIDKFEEKYGNATIVSVCLLGTVTL